MTLSSLKPLGLALAVTVALAACQKTEAPAETAAVAPAAAEPAPLKVEPKTPSISFKASDLDTNLAACTDFNGYVNGKWLAANEIPADRATWGSFESLAERSLEVQEGIVTALGARDDNTGTRKLLADLWVTGMDEAAINAAGLAPLQSQLDAIAKIDSGEAAAQFLRNSYAKGQGYVFSFGVNPDFVDSSLNILYAGQAGLGLPDPSYYSDPKFAPIREKYVAHIANVFKLAGADEATAATQAAAVMAFETRLAAHSMTTEELSRDVKKYYNATNVADADALTPNFKWSTFFESQGVAAPAMFSLSQPDFHKEVNAMLADVPAADWQSYLRFHAIDDVAPFLADAYAQENFDFYGKTLNGQQEMRPRGKRVLNTINGQVGEALGQEYVQVAFSPEAKARMEELVGNLTAALKVRLEKLDWMSPETKAKALEKWAAFTPKIGYPDKWRDWTGLETSRDGYLANVLAAAEFNYRWNLGKAGQPVDRTEWGMTPQLVNAQYNPQNNDITFPAAILQPPFFDPNADDALNYGGIGAVIGHEMIHGYDDQGSRFGPTGNFANWWTDADTTAFNARTGMLVDQFSQYVALDEHKVDGGLTLGENIADLGGLAVSYDALQKALENKRVGEIDGFSPDQRFYLNWGTVWRRAYRPENLMMRLTTDPHAPSTFRAIGAPSNQSTFAAAFSCKEGDAMVRPADAKVAIW